jgi:hypothetical protein
MSLLLDGTNGLSDVDGTAATPAIRGTDANTGIFFPAADTIAFSEGGVEAARFDSSGNLGIGTTNPSRRLEITGSTDTNSFLQVNSSLTAAQSIFGVTSTNVGFLGTITNNDFTFRTNNAERARIDSSGNLLVGTTSNPGFKFYVNGTVSATGSVSFPQSNNDTTANAANMNIQGDGFLRRSTSALKYKQDVRDLESIDVNLFRPVRYKSKCVSDDQTKDHIGIVADEVAAAGIEELVNRGADGEVEGFQYERLNVILLKAIQEQQATISAMETRLAALEA